MKRSSGLILSQFVLLTSVDAFAPPRTTINVVRRTSPLFMATKEKNKSGFLGRIFRKGNNQDEEVAILESVREEEFETTTSASPSLGTDTEDEKKLGFFGRVFGGRGGNPDAEEVAAVTEPVMDDVAVDEECVIEEELTETEKLMKQVKEAGTAGVVSYALWELAFWFASVPVAIAGFKAAIGHWPNLSDSDDMSKLGAEAFAFVNFARFAVPLRIGLALGTTPWIQENVIDGFFPKEESDCVEPMEEINI